VQTGIKMPKDWDKSLMVNVYKCKGDALECGSYRGITFFYDGFRKCYRKQDAEHSKD